MRNGHQGNLDSPDQSSQLQQRTASMPIGIVIRVSPGVTRWASWNRRVVGVLPGSGDAHWREIRREGPVIEYHAGTLPLELYRSDTEAYKQGLSARTPSLFVVMRESVSGINSDAQDLELILVTASPFEAQDYMDSGEEIVEPVPMPPAVIAWIREFSDFHHTDEGFYKRQRDRIRVDRKQDGIGDARIHQASDVYRAPRKVMWGTRPAGDGETIH